MVLPRAAASRGIKISARLRSATVDSRVSAQLVCKRCFDDLADSLLPPMAFTDVAEVPGKLQVQPRSALLRIQPN